MTLGIECLVTDDARRAAELAAQLDAINRERRDVEAGMREQAQALLEALMPAGEPPAALSLFDAQFHEGVVGIVAGRLKDRLHRPVFVFARGQDGLLKGSGRSIPGFHLRDALDLVSKRHPELLRRFGGHAMAAGCTLAEPDFGTFEQAFRQVALQWLDAAALQRRLRTDGPLALEYFNAATVATLDAQVWGRRLRGAAVLRRGAGGAAAPGGRKAHEIARAPPGYAARRDLVRPRRAAARAGAARLPAQPGRVPGPATGADDRRNGHAHVGHGVACGPCVRSVGNS